MLRVTSVLVVLVSACAPTSFAVRESVQKRAPNEALAHAVTEVAPDARHAHGSKLAPPFGRSAGVRRVREPGEPAPAVIAAADRQN